MNNHSIKELIQRILPFVQPFFTLIVFSFIANMLFAAANAAILASVEPVFRTLFNADAASVMPRVGTDTSSLKSWYDAFMQKLIIGETFYISIRNLSIFIFVLFAIRGLLKYLSRIISVRMEEGIMKSIRDTMFLRLTSLSMDFFGRNKTGNIISLLTNDVGVLNHSAINSVTGLWREGITVVIYVALLIAISPMLTAIALLISIGSFLAIRLSTKLLRRYGATDAACPG